MFEKWNEFLKEQLGEKYIEPSVGVGKNLQKGEYYDSKNTRDYKRQCTREE